MRGKAMVAYLQLVFLIATGIRVRIIGIDKNENETIFIFLFGYVIFTEISQAEAYDILQKCVLEIQKRLIINLSNFKVAVVDKNGVRNLDDVSSKSLLNYVP